ncbi:hypothetical protein D3C85_772100 [compost metagenome]
MLLFKANNIIFGFCGPKVGGVAFLQICRYLTVIVPNFFFTAVNAFNGVVLVAIGMAHITIVLIETSF